MIENRHLFFFTRVNILTSQVDKNSGLAAAGRSPAWPSVAKMSIRKTLQLLTFFLSITLRLYGENQILRISQDIFQCAVRPWPALRVCYTSPPLLRKLMVVYVCRRPSWDCNAKILDNKSTIKESKDK